jgi:lipoprotein-releasing system ATP-binding protein
MSTLKATLLAKTFHQPTPIGLFEQISLAVNPGESLAIMGKSGVGKSTLLHILGTLEPATSGTLEICGKLISPENAAEMRLKHIGFIFQAFHLFDDLTVLDNVLMPARIARQPTHPGSPAHSRALELLKQVDLLDRSQFVAKLLSGGEKQRVGIARALCNDPDLILADEPSGNLDHATSSSIHHLLISLAKNQGKALIVVTHDVELAALASHRLILKDQRLCTS